MKKIILVVSVSLILLESCAKAHYGTARATHHQHHKCDGSRGVMTAMGRM